MRQSRLRKFRSKYRGFWFTTKIILIWYLLLFSIMHFTSNTSAVFSDATSPAGKIESGYWPVDYQLVFTEKGNSNFDACGPFEVKRTIKNKGKEDMNDAASYEVYYHKANPKKHGEKVGEGSIPALKKNQTEELKFTAEEPGRYAFVAKYETVDGEMETWSFEIKVDCGSGQKTDNVKEKSNEDHKSAPEQSTEDAEKNEPNQEKVKVQDTSENKEDNNTEVEQGQQPEEKKESEAEITESGKDTVPPAEQEDSEVLSGDETKDEVKEGEEK